MSSSKYEIQRQPGTSMEMAGTEDEKFQSGWIEWIIANLLVGAGSQDMLRVMIKAGFSEAYASAKLDEYKWNTTIRAAINGLAVQRKAYDILESLGKLEHKSPFGKQVDIVQNLPIDDFYHDYFFRNRPVVLQGLTTEWKAMQLWTPEYFASRFGDAEVEVVTGRENDPQHEYNLNERKKQMTMRDYARMVVEGGETNDFYLTAQNLLMVRPEFQELYGHITGLNGYLDESRFKGRVRVWFGPKGTITRLHHDAAPVLLAQIYGHKQVKLISPMHLRNISSDGGWLCTMDLENLDYDRFPAMRNVDILEVTLGPGDLLFIPLGWWHWVKSLDVSISVSLDNFQGVARDEIELNWKRG
jgi:Cupin-like domain